MRRLLALTLTATACAVVVPTLAAAGPIPENLEVTLASPVEPLTFDLQVDDAISCDAGTLVVVSVEANGAPVEPLSVVLDDADPNHATMVLPSDTAPGQLDVITECEDGETPEDASGTEGWAAIAVTKVVDGPAPADAAFVVDVDCLAGAAAAGGFTGIAGMGVDVSVSLEYGATGGTKYVYFDGPSDCTITEPVNGGATSTTITPGEVFVDDPELFTSTVTNTFAVAAEPTFTG